MAGDALSRHGERALVEMLRRLHDPDGRSGIGDDCAVVRQRGGALVATTDITFDGVHYPSDAPARSKGWYAAAVNLSDIAAMGAEPLGLLVAYGFPPETQLRDFRNVARGVEDCAAAHGTRVLGGDTKGFGNLTICATALGVATHGGPLMRSGAKPGDILVLTGKVGRAHEWAATNGRSGLGRMLKVEPRLREGVALARAGATSCVDLSDGLALSIHLLADASQCGMVADFDAVPFFDAVRSEDRAAAASYGGDFELLATVPRDKVAAAIAAVEGVGGVLAVIGEVGGRKVRYISSGRERPLPKEGFEHLRGGCG
jgi:thiamine-monophosphate kinase